nr:hypothetical protein GCM10020063_034750 [Dactylosporangium thailandense]
MLIASLTCTPMRSRAASPAQAAPASIAAGTMSARTAPPGRCRSVSSPIPAAPTAPATIWPSPPTLSSPARAGTATARPASSSTAKRTSTVSACAGSTREVSMSRYIEKGSTPRAATNAPKMTGAATTATSHFVTARFMPGRPP